MSTINFHKITSVMVIYVASCGFIAVIIIAIILGGFGGLILNSIGKSMFNAKIANNNDTKE